MIPSRKFVFGRKRGAGQQSSSSPRVAPRRRTSSSSRRDGNYQLIPGALHGIALRAPWGTPVRLPRAHGWARLVSN
jgi:hypothetical protein